MNYHLEHLGRKRGVARYEVADLVKGNPGVFNDGKQFLSTVGMVGKAAMFSIFSRTFLTSILFIKVLYMFGKGVPDNFHIRVVPDEAEPVFDLLMELVPGHGRFGYKHYQRPYFLSCR